jgi:hypothetical protein
MQGLRANRLAYIIVLATAFLAVFAAAAWASGSFTWTVNFKDSVTSRNYSTPNKGLHTITALVHNNGDSTGKAYTIDLVRVISLWPDHHYGKQNYTANTTVSRSWSVADTGTFHFDVKKVVSSGVYWTGGGTTYYP